MSNTIRNRAKALALIALAVGMSAMSIGCKVSGGQIGGSVGRGPTGRPTGSIGGTIIFKNSIANNESEVVDEDTGQVYQDDGTLDYSAVQGNAGDSYSGVVETTEYLYGGGGGGGGCGGGNEYMERQMICYEYNTY